MKCASESIGITMETFKRAVASRGKRRVFERTVCLSGRGAEIVSCGGRGQVCGNMIRDRPHARADEHPPVYF